MRARDAVKRSARLIAFPSGKTVAQPARQPAEPSALVSKIRRLETERPNVARIIERLVDGVIEVGPITAKAEVFRRVIERVAAGEQEP